MEFKLNKIDTDIRKRLNEERRESKVHHGKGINVNQDFKEDHVLRNNKDEDELKEQKQKRFITIDGIKDRSEKIKIEAEKEDIINIQDSKGRILDIRK